MTKSYIYDGKKFTYEELKRNFDEADKQVLKNPGKRISTTLKMIEGTDVLDVGCAGGSLTRHIANMGFKVLGTDILESSIEIAKEFNNVPNASYEFRDLFKEPFPAESFDCITFLETIEHVENPGLFLKEFHRILRPNGCIVLSTPNATSLKNSLYALSYRKKEKRIQIAKEISSEKLHTGTQIEHVNNWDFPTLVRLLDRCGFELADHAFVRSGPIYLPIFGKKIEFIKLDSNILNRFEPLKTTHIMKARKKVS